MHTMHRTGRCAVWLGLANTNPYPYPNPNPYPYPNPNPNPNPYRQQAEVPRVVKAISRQLKEKSVKTRVAAFNCTRQLVEP